MYRITLSNLKEATKQQVFDRICAHLFTQMMKSETVSGVEECLYKSPNGLRCAAGCLISDNEYVTSMEGKYWEDLFPYKKLHSDLISKMQYLHDKCDVKNWYSEMLQVSKIFDLEFKHGR